MGFLESFFDVYGAGTEEAVHCPFPHVTPNGMQYYESNPSAHVNLEKRLIHCKVCGEGFNELQLIHKLFGCELITAKRIQNNFQTNETVEQWDSEVALTNHTIEKLAEMGINKETIEHLKIKSSPMHQDEICFPVTMYGHLLDIRKYSPGTHPKVRSRQGAIAGLIIPFDSWIESNKVTLICAGEKDMAIARQNGFNAITLTGGENAPIRPINLFKQKKVAILYDNDSAGALGAIKLARQLKTVTDKVKIVTNFHEVCKEDGEDLHDYFVKYNKTRQNLIACLEQTDWVTDEALQITRGLHNNKTISLLKAAKPENLNKTLYTNVQITAVAESTYSIPSAIWLEKWKQVDHKDTMAQGECRTWELSEITAKDILHLIDNNFTESQIKSNIKNLLKVPEKERCVSIKPLERATVFKCQVTDLFETSNTEVTALEFTAYSINQKLESGKKYLIEYRLAPHPYKGQHLVMVVLNATQANDSVSNFTVTNETKEQLNEFRGLTGSASEKINLITEKFKSFLGYNGNNTLIQTLDLAYHTPIEFDFGTFKNIRGYLDTLIVGESRTGKSSTAETMRKVYGLGTFTSLAGASATIPGLIGGSNKTAGGGFQTRAGAIPQNHKGLMIFEELSKCNANVIAELTDIRSSNEVRITRVSGTLSLPALVRMITLSNAKTKHGVIKPIAGYPNGITVVTELVHSAEDIARYDLLAVFADKGESQINPFWRPPEPFSEKAYKTRVRWIWSRTPDQIIISEEVGLYLVNTANDLNKLYDCHIKIFGTEAWKKLARVTVAIAGSLVSTDNTYEKIIVLKEHVDEAATFLKKLYDNPVFKLKEYVEHERRYSVIDDDGVQLLQDIYNQCPAIILQLEQCAAASKNVLSASTGLGTDDLNKALMRLTKGLFIRFENHDIIPTERFRLGLNRIIRNTRVRRIGEQV